MAGGSGAIRAGRAFVELFADPSALNRALEGAKRRVEAFAKSMAKIGATTAGLGATVFGPMTKFFVDAVKEGAQVDALAKRFHTTAEAISTLRGAFAQAGIGGEEFAGIMDSLAIKISHATDSHDELISGLQGLRGDMLIGKSPDEQLDMIAEKFKTIVNVNDRIRVANELGLGGMLPFLEKGKAGLDAMRDAAVASGEAMNSEDAKAASTIYKEFNKTMIAAKATLISVGKALLPTGKDFASVGQDIRENLQFARDWIASHKEVIVTIAAVAGGLVAGGTAIAGFGAAVAVAAPIIGGLIIAIKATIAVVAAMASPIGLAVVAVGGLTAGLLYLFSQTTKGQEVFASLKSSVAEAFEFIKGVWGGISDAISAGDWSLAFEIGTTAITVAWTECLSKIEKTWADFKGIFVNGWSDATTEIAKKLQALDAEIEANTGMSARNLEQELKDYLTGDVWDISKYPKMRSVEEINKEKEQVQKQLDQMNKEFKEKNQNISDKDVEAAKKKADEAKAKLKALQDEAKQAKEKAKAADWARKPWLEYDDEDRPTSKLPSFTQLFANQKGIFGGSAVQQQLGYGDNTAQRQLDATNTVAANTAASLPLLQKIATQTAASGGEVYTA